MGDLVRITRAFGLDEQADAAAAWGATFPVPGAYRVERLEEEFAKAEAAGGHEEDFEEWFLQRLFEVSKGRQREAAESMWEVLDDLLVRRGVHAPSELDQYELNRALFDLTHASTARMVGLRVPQVLSTRLTALGWTAPEILDFPAIAYRIGRIYDELAAAPASMPWPRLVELAQSKPLSSIERAAVDQARQHAGVWLKPIFDDTGRVWTAEREIEPLRELTSRAIAERRGVRRAARELANTNRAKGIFRDAERVMRTEIADASGRATWAENSKRWQADDLLYRPTSANPCKVCLRLFKEPSGMPRLYTRADVERQDALGINTGPSKDWHVRLGPIHPNCVCPAWQRWHQALERILTPGAERFAAMIKQLRVFEEKEAA